MPAVSEPDWLIASRKTAATAAAQAPNRDVREDWLYTATSELQTESATVSPAAIRELVERHALPEAWLVLVFVGGSFEPSLSRLTTSPDGIVASLAQTVASQGEAVSALLGAGDPSDAPLLAQNRERWSDGLFLKLERGQKLPGPVQVLEIGSGSSWLRHLVVMGEESSAILWETHVSPDGVPVAAHSVLQTRLEAGATLSHVRFRDQAASGRHYGAVVASVQARARLETRLYGFGGVVSRDDFQISLDAPEAFALLHGLVKTDNTEKADISVKLRHASPDCQSEQVFKALAGGKSQANFHGTVYVDRDAQRTAARQSNKNLLLSREASINSRPQLEILADDVKCSHGSATGRLDEKAMQFLRMRGLSESGARALLVRAFAGEMLLALPEESLRERIDARLGDA